MPCTQCIKKPVYTLPNSNRKLCKSCFIKYFEKKALKTISRYNLISYDDRIAVAVSGGKDSFSVLCILLKVRDRLKNIDLHVIGINEGFRDFTDLKNFCKQHHLPLHIYSFKEEFKYSLSQIIRKVNLKSCSLCGVLRRFIINKKARELKANKVATGHNLDDEAQAILMNEFKGQAENSARLGPLTGIKSFRGFIRRIKPLYFLTEEETLIYAKFKNYPGERCKCPYGTDSFRHDVKTMLNRFTKKHRQTKHSIINSFLKVKPLLEKSFDKRSRISYCESCGEPCSGQVCKVCEFLKKIKK